MISNRCHRRREGMVVLACFNSASSQLNKALGIPWNDLEFLLILLGLFFKTYKL